jgi:translation elongation factor EF-4
LAGKLKKSIALNSCAFNKTYQLFDVGVLQPELNSQEELTPGQIGYAISNMKEVKEARIGDTFFKVGSKVDPQPGFSPSKPMLFAGVYPLDPD